MAAIYSGNPKIDKINELAHAALHQNLIMRGERKPNGKNLTHSPKPQAESIHHLVPIISQLFGKKSPEHK